MTEELKRTLNRPKWLRRDIDVTKAKMEQLRVMMLPGAIRYDKDSVQSSPKDPMLEFAEKIDALERQLKAQEKDYLEAYELAEHTIKSLEEPRYVNILSLRYLAGYDHIRIAKLTGYTEGHVYKLQREAQKKLDRK